MSSSLSISYEPLLLGSNDPSSVEIVNPESTYPVVLVCEHAGNLVPLRLQNLGLSQSLLEKHIAWDIGAENTARILADKLGATLILQRYSRLVIDCNRPPESEASMLTVSDGHEIDGNLNLSERDKQQRIEEIFEPFQQAVNDKIALSSCKMALSIHSFTRAMNGFVRPWDVGFLFRNDQKTSHELASDLSSILPSACIGMNQPYQIEEDDDWFVPKQGEASGKYHSLIEICNDQIDSENGQSHWANQLATMINRTVKRMIS